MPSEEARNSKGERTAQRILDVAEPLFAARGYEGTSLREIARGAGIREPGLYNHFKGKQALYEAVLDRALRPMAEAIETHLGSAAEGADPTGLHASLPEMMTDLLVEHPAMAALFQQALQGDADSTGTRLVRGWLDRLFQLGVDALREVEIPGVDPNDLAVRVIAMFNVTTGYFLSERAFHALDAGNPTDPDNLARQKRLLLRLARANLLE